MTNSQIFKVNGWLWGWVINFCEALWFWVLVKYNIFGIGTLVAKIAAWFIVHVIF